MTAGRFNGHISLVTGASSGIGAGVARALAAEGDQAIAAARRADRLAALTAEIAASRAEPRMRSNSTSPTLRASRNASPASRNASAASIAW